MKRLIASFAALGLVAVPAVAATTPSKPKPAATKTHKDVKASGAMTTKAAPKKVK